VFSVIINNYNYGRFIGPAISSVLAQTFSDFELIIVDDGSTDDSREIIDSYEDPRIIKILKANAGQGLALRDGLERARGQWIAFLDSDDRWKPEKLTRCAAVLSEDKEISYLVHGYETIDGAGAAVSTHEIGRPSGYYDPLPDISRLAFRLPFVPTSFFCSQRDFVDRVTWDPVQWRICADLPFMGGLPVLGKTYILNEVLGEYRLHADNQFASRNSEREIAKTLAQLYDLISLHLSSIGDSRRFDFRKTEFYKSQTVMSTSASSFAGIKARLDYRMTKLLNRLRSTQRTQ
jgi:glycosyltransferase involved in cell wall biosynthesis